MEKIYDPQLIESKWDDFWAKLNYFNVAEQKNMANYFCIMLPPPNVTGSLHMGHAFQHTIMDALIRFNKMNHNVVLWQPGMDHAGISTQMVVERQLASQNIKRTDLTRDAFVKKVWDWKEEYGGQIKQQMQRLGTFIDWSRGKFTLDPDFSSAVKLVFIKLYQEGFIYRGKKLINWDPTLQTAISDLEVVNEECQGNLWYINYPLVNPKNPEKNYLTIATTRPETLLGDVAVCVNPEDPRYKDLIGSQVIVPIVNKAIPIIADSYVDPDYGTGCLKITPAHDFNDYKIAVDHNLPFINIFTKDAKLNNNVPDYYQGLDKLAARDKILQELKDQELLIKTEDITIIIPKSSNTNTIVEPLLTDQWFIKMDQLAKPAIEAVKSGLIKFIPEEWATVYFNWLNNIQDWCISRQLWWGHQIPAWYDKEGKVYVGDSEETIRKEYNLADNIELTQETDVLDTWFSSALWPFVTLGWPNKEDLYYNKFFPTSVLVTGFDIIFFWVARMVIFSLKFTGQIPFNTVYITGLIQDHDGQKMSKSKGNVIDPLDLIDGISLEQLLIKRTSGLMQPKLKQTIEHKTKKQFPNGISNYGTDALRFTFCSIATHSRHIKFELLRLEGNRHFCNKIWNAARFILFHNANNIANIDLNNNITLLADKWILSIWQKYKNNIINNFSNYRFDLVAHHLYDFIWNEYCDWYLELVKININNNTTKAILNLILQEIILMLHPIMPHITEEIWTALWGHKKQQLSLLDYSYPQFNSSLVNNTCEQELSFIKKFINSVRNIRGTMNISPAVMLPIVFINNNLNNILANQDLIKNLAKIKELEIKDQTNQKGMATAMVEDMVIWINLAGLIDSKAEVTRLNKEIKKLEQQLLITNNKLANQKYLNNAPPEVVIKERNKSIELQRNLEQLKASLEVIVNLED